MQDAIQQAMSSVRTLQEAGVRYVIASETLGIGRGVLGGNSMRLHGIGG